MIALARLWLVWGLLSINGGCTSLAPRVLRRNMVDGLGFVARPEATSRPRSARPGRGFSFSVAKARARFGRMDQRPRGLLRKIMTFVDAIVLALVLVGMAGFVVSLKWLSSRYVGSTADRG